MGLASNHTDSISDANNSSIHHKQCNDIQQIAMVFAQHT